MESTFVLRLSAQAGLKVNRSMAGTMGGLSCTPSLESGQVKDSMGDPRGSIHYVIGNGVFLLCRIHYDARSIFCVRKLSGWFCS